MLEPQTYDILYIEKWINCSCLVSALWGAFVYHEFSDWKVLKINDEHDLLFFQWNLWENSNCVISI